MEVGHGQPPTSVPQRARKRFSKSEIVFLAFMAVIALAILVAGAVELF